jgi:hypothetical protein
MARELSITRTAAEKAQLVEPDSRPQEERTAPKPAAEAVVEEPRGLTQEADALEQAARKIASPEAVAEALPSAPTPSAEPAEPAARVRAIDEEAAAGILGSRATGDAAERFRLDPVSGNSIESALTRITREGGVAAAYGKLTEDAAGNTLIDLETNKKRRKWRRDPRQSQGRDRRVHGAR